MAKRKRLTPAQSGFLDSAPIGGAPETKATGLGGGLGGAPIAQVAGDAAAQAALEELTSAMQEARSDGRLIERLPLDAIDAGYLVRDRMEQDEDEMEALMASLVARGQQTAIEVTRLPGDETRYGLISGWRRLTALRRLYEGEKEPRFATVKALVIAPDTAQSAYVAMVEENEIRVNLSFYERARITLKALREGIYPTQRTALQGLFGSTTRSRRSKIGSFVPVVEAFDDLLRYPTAISERLGLSLSREILRNPEFVSNLRKTLSDHPDRTAGEEMQILARAVEVQVAPPVESVPETRPEPPAPQVPAGEVAPVPESAPAASGGADRHHAAPGIALSFHAANGRIELTGANVDAGLRDALLAWLAVRNG